MNIPILDLIIKGWYLYLIGFIAFIVGFLNDITNKKIKTFPYYIQDIFSTILSIILSIAICYVIETKPETCYIVSIFMGLIGPTIIRKLLMKKEYIGEKVIDKLSDKIIDNVDTISDKILNDKNNNQINDGE